MLTPHPQAARVYPMDELQTAIQWAGTQANLARLLGVDRSTVQQWIRRGQVSVDGANAIHRATNGKIARKRLRPDIFA